jgi:deoxyribodipyrimidine photo-lyase
MASATAIPHRLESRYVRDQISLRGRRLNEQPTDRTGEMVLYWMQSTHRFEENWALRFAVLQADRLGKPLLVYQGLDPTYEHANDRIHTFIIDNARHLARRAASLGFTYRFHLRRRRSDDRRVVDALAKRAALVVTDWFPTAGIAERSERFASRTSRRVVAIESHAIVPSGIFVREEYAARTIRPKMFSHLTRALEKVEDHPPEVQFPDSLLASLPLDFDVADADVAAEVAACEIDHTVAPVALKSGLHAARERLRQFCDDALPHYSSRRADPNDSEGSSRLSAYLHFGQIAAAEVARTALASGAGRQADAFLNELVVWRELALNFCLRNPAFASLDALPPWVHKTMRDHTRDAREATYTLDAFEQGKTHDPLWNAAQMELRTTGVIHNVVRMLWGKHLLAWAPNYRKALAWAIHLNNKYGIDGRDPSSYAGIQWCFGKFDRPFYTRPVFGVIRSMSLQRAADKWDTKRYVARWAGSEPVRGRGKSVRGGAQT